MVFLSVRPVVVGEGGLGDSKLGLIRREKCFADFALWKGKAGVKKIELLKL